MHKNRCCRAPVKAGQIAISHARVRRRSKDSSKVHKGPRRADGHPRYLEFGKRIRPRGHIGNETPIAARSADRCRTPRLPFNYSRRTNFS